MEKKMIDNDLKILPLKIDVAISKDVISFSDQKVYKHTYKSTIKNTTFSHALYIKWICSTVSESQQKSFWRGTELSKCYK